MNSEAFECYEIFVVSSLADLSLSLSLCRIENLSQAIAKIKKSALIVTTQTKCLPIVSSTLDVVLKDVIFFF